MAVGDAALGQIVGRHFQHDTVSRENTNEVQTHFPGDMSKHAMTVFQFNPEHSVRQQLDDLAIYFDSVFGGHVNTSG